MKNLSFSFMLFLCMTSGSSGQVTFQRSYGTGSQFGYSIHDVNGGYILLGSSGIINDINIVRTDEEGEILWIRQYGGADNDEAFGMDETYDGGFIIAGYTQSFTGLNPNDSAYAYLLKINDTGDLLWSRVFDIGKSDIVFSVKETFDHGFILTGSASLFSTGPRDMFLIKTDSIGNLEWSQIFGSANSGTDIGRSVIQTRDSGYAVVGMSDGFVAPDTALMLIITNANGTALYSRYYQIDNASVSDNVTYAYDLVQDQNGDLIMTGGTGGNFQNLFYAYTPFLLKTDSTGNHLVCKVYSTNTGASKGYSVRQTSNGDYIMGVTLGNFYPMMILTDGSLNKLWCYYYGHFSTPQLNNAGFGLQAIETSDGGFALTGSRTYTNPGSFMNLVKTNALGQSGCNQGVPTFAGNSSVASYTLLNDSLLSIPSAIEMPVASIDFVTSMPDSILCISTGIIETDEIDFQIFPNPAIDQLTLDFDSREFKEMKLEITDACGKLLLRNTITTSSYSIKVSELKKGMYFVILRQSEKIIAVKKLIKQ